MRKDSGTCLVLVVAACLAVGQAGADEGRVVKVLARGPWPHLPTHAAGGDRAEHQWVIRSEDELAKAAGKGALIDVPRILKVRALDFKKQMLVAVEDGTQPLVGVSGGGPPSAPCTVAITRVELDEQGKTLMVRWRRAPRGKEQGILTRPLEAVLIERFEGEVKFEKLPTQDGPDKEEAKPAGKEFAPLARALWPDGWRAEVVRQEWVVRSADDLVDPRIKAPEEVVEQMRREAEARYAKALNVDRIDFTKQMVLGVSAGVQPAGSRVEVTRIEMDGKGTTMTVHWRLHRPEGSKPVESITHPAEIVLVEQFAGRVVFQQDGGEEK